MKKIASYASLALTRIFILFIAFSLLIIFYQSSSNLSQLTKKQPSDTTDVNYKYWIDSSNIIDNKNILDNISLFKQTTPAEIPFALKDQTYWVLVDIKNTQSHHVSLVLFADNKLLDVFKVYPIKNNTIQKNLTLQHLPFHQIYPHINIELTPRNEQSYLLQIRTDGPPNVPILLISQSTFDLHILTAQFLYGAFIGIALLMILYNLVLFFAVKDKVYLFYIGYLLSAFLIMSSITGFGYILFDDFFNQQIDKYLIPLHFLLVLFLLFFTLFFLRYDKQQSITYRIAITVCFCLVVAIFATLTLDKVAQATVFFSIQPLVFILAIYLLIKRIRGNLSWAKYYLASWIPLLIGAAIQPAVLLNIIDYSFLTSNAFLIAIIAEVSLMAFALAERMRRNEQDKITNIAYHLSSGIPRKSNLETCINNLVQQKYNDFSVCIVKPEHIEKVALYINDEMNTQLFKQLYGKLSSLFQYNDAIIPITDKQEKICLINHTCFALIIDHHVDEQPAEMLFESIQQVVQENFHITQVKLPLTAVIGLARFPVDGDKSHLLLNRALIATANAENNVLKWSHYENDVKDTTQYLFKLTSDLKQAIKNNTLMLYHQPQVDLRTLRVCSSECLLRWQHAKEGFIPPNVFIPIAEDMGLIHEVTFWVIQQALHHQKQLMDEYGFNHLVSINISGKDISSKHFLARALDIIEASGVASDKIIFELTESASFTNNAHTMRVIEQLTDLGITISIDDFGTGYSSMSQISHLPFQELKVDRQFVENINQDKKRLVIAEATVKMAKGLGLEVVAEGINSEEDEATLRKFGCDIGQGYYYAKPMPLEEYKQWLTSLVQGRVKTPLKGEYIPVEK
ncbi:EAL domain-containing protein [Thalassotalea sp. PP2-459]|uniref:EAL domain-containing protein n=1 Tax=Thalassotalea sp. PP2-459 TaxID=1742724 RepID=UPI0009444437|nr:EAL domain-containing protein [Thalassotalea sp. PP2-459]OKY27788.1 hypothetical protein BI291_07685 [Thalassotalea sp. PP2-459]